MTLREWLVTELRTAEASGDTKRIAYWQARLEGQVAAEARAEATTLCPRGSASRAWKYWMLR